MECCKYEDSCLQIKVWKMYIGLFIQVLLNLGFHAYLQSTDMKFTKSVHTITQFASMHLWNEVTILMVNNDKAFELPYLQESNLCGTPSSTIHTITLTFNIRAHWILVFSQDMKTFLDWWCQEASTSYRPWYYFTSLMCTNGFGWYFMKLHFFEICKKENVSSEYLFWSFEKFCNWSWSSCYINANVCSSFL